MRQLVNPRGHLLAGDCRYTDLYVPPKAALISDETLLAAFTRGFFGGGVFGPERLFLRLVRPASLYFLGTSRHDAGQTPGGRDCSFAARAGYIWLTFCLWISEVVIPSRI